MCVSAARDSTPPPLCPFSSDRSEACLPASWLAGRGQFVEAIPNTCCQEWIDFSVSFFAPQMGLTHCRREPLDGAEEELRGTKFGHISMVSLSLLSSVSRATPGKTTAGPDRTTRLCATPRRTLFGSSENGEGFSQANGQYWWTEMSIAKYKPENGSLDFGAIRICSISPIWPSPL